MPLDSHREANRLNWNDRVPIHWGPDGYNAAGFIADKDQISRGVQADRPYLGDVTGKRLVHLQCHFGKDTLSWARLGAEVTGIDFSDAAITAAHRLSIESGTPGRFVLAELYDTPLVLAGEQFDIVYTGGGSLCWLPDIAGWGKVVATMLAPGGMFYIREGHPMMWSLDWPEEEVERLTIRFPYFETGDPTPWSDDSTYAGTGTVAHPQTYDWSHGLAEVMGALTGNGLVIDLFEEHRSLHWQGHPSMTEGADGLWRLPEGRQNLVALEYSLRARKPR